ncbi:MAG: efflux RND transporter periplasmic adaptor subunit [Hyphomicrobiaceae bacterium]
MHVHWLKALITVAAGVAVLAWIGWIKPPAVAGESESKLFTVREQEVDDLKTVFATVQSKDKVDARVRTPGTVAALKVDEGAHVAPGQVLAIVVDQKIALKIKALDAQIVALESREQTARTDFERAEELRRRDVTPQARVDQLKTAYDVAVNDLKAARAERAVVERQIEEGQVLAPAAGRVLKVPVTEGNVVLAGESIATIAANEYLLRLELPERHARFMKKGDAVKVGARGLAPDQAVIGEGRIVQVYPELENGRVVADAEVPALGDYFVGERARVWISAGRRTTMAVPAAFVFKRYGLDYVRLVRDKGPPLDVVVQVGRATTLDGGLNGEADGVEILAGLTPGDTLVLP